MSLDETQSTDVITGGDSPAAASESTDALAPSVEQSGEQAQERSGDDTAQSASVEASVVKEGETTPPPPAEDDPLEGIPEADELERLVEQRVPHAQAVLQLRKALEARNSELAELRGKSLTAEPVLPLIEQAGGAEAAQAKLQTFDSLFSPVIDPNNGQPVRDPVTGLPVLDPTPFVERVESENPGLAERLTFAGLNCLVETGDGRKARVYQLPEVQTPFLQALGLDPERLDDYRNIDARSFAQDTGVTPEELTEIPEQFHETYKALPPGIRADLKVQDEATRQFNLEVYKERADRKAEETQRQQAEAQNRQQQEVQARQYVAKEQDSFVAQHLQESHAAIMDDLARQVTFSENAAENAAMHGVVGAFLVALRDPEAQFAIGKTLEAHNLKVDPSFYEALADADKHLRDAKAYELFGQQGLKQQSLTAASNAKKLALAKASPIALRIAQALGGQKVKQATKQNGAIDGATRTRPVPGGEGGEEADGILPAGMLPTDPRAGVYIARRNGLLGG